MSVTYIQYHIDIDSLLKYLLLESNVLQLLVIETVQFDESCMHLWGFRVEVL